MLSTLQVSQINIFYEKTYPVITTANNTLSCGLFAASLKNNNWIITPIDSDKVLASVFNKQYAHAIMRVASAFYTLSEKDQQSLRPNLAPAILEYIEALHKAKTVKKHPGGRPKSPIKRRYKQYWISEEEDIAIKALLAQMRKK